MPVTPPALVEELEGSPRFDITAEGRWTATREFRLSNWTFIDFFVNDLLGYSVPWAAGTILGAPASFPGVEYLVVSGVAVSPFDGASPDGDDESVAHVRTSTYQGGARFVVNYRLTDARDPHQPAVPPGTYLEWTQDSGLDPLQVPGNAWSFVGGAVPYDATAPLLLPIAMIHHTLRWMNVPKPPFTAMRKSLGNVNSATFLGAVAGTVLFESYAIERVPQLSGLPKYNINYRFAEKAIPLTADPDTIVGWNYGYSPEPDGGEHWLEIVNNNDSSTPFQTINMDNLFVLAADA